MRKYSHLAVIVLLWVLAQLLPIPTLQAAPGDFLFQWGSQQHFSNPSGLAADANGNVFVTNIDHIQVFNSAVRIRKWGSYGSGDGQLSHPNGIAVDVTGKVYVADTGNDRVEVFDSSGGYLGKWTHPDWTTRPPVAVASDGRGKVYVAESGPDSVVKVFDANGNFLRQLGSIGSGPGQYLVPCGVAVDIDGNAYVADPDGGRVQVYNPVGEFVKTMVDGRVSPRGIAVDQSGNLYLVAMGRWDTMVEVYDSAGNFVRYLGPYDGGALEYEEYWIATAVAVDGKGTSYTLGYLYARGLGTGVSAFDSAGNQLREWWAYGAWPGQLSRPQGVAVDRSGKVYETDGHEDRNRIINDRVQIFSGDGNSVGRWTLNVPQTSGITLDDSGNVYVLQTINPNSRDEIAYPGSVGHVYDPSGNFLREIGVLIPCHFENGQCLGPYGIAIDKSGNLLVTDQWNSMVSIYDNGGTFLKNIQSPDGFANPRGIAVDPTGNIFVADTGNSRVQVFDSAYNFIRKWGSQGSGDGQMASPAGIAVDGGGHVFVADAGNNRIQVFDTSGTFLKKWGGEGDEKGQFRSAEGIALDKTGTRIYVADTGNNRIQVFEGYGAVGPFTLSGTVRQGSDTGPVLPGATVSIAGKTAITGSTGAFSITGIPAGSYTLTISRTGYVTKTISGYEVRSNGSGLVFNLTRVTYSLSGTVRKGSLSGPVLSGVTVSIAGRRAVTGSDGTFTVTGIPSGTYTLYLSKTGYVSKSITGYAVNSNRSGAVFYLTPAAYTVSGTVRQRSSTGPVLPGATVSIAGKTTTTGSTGTFSIAGIPTGTYSMTISKPGFVTRTVTGLLIDRNRSGLLYYLIKK